MMPFNVRQRLLLVALLPASLLAIVLTAYFTFISIDALDKELRQRGLAMVRYLAPISEYSMLSGQIDSLQNQAQAAARQPAVKAVLMISRDGRILAVSGRVSLSADQLRRPLEEPVLVAQGEQWIGYGAPIVRSTTEVDDLFTPKEQSPVKAEVIGKIFVEIDTSEVFSRQQNLLARGLLILLGGLALAAAYANRIAARATEPLMRLVDAVHDMTSGKYEVRVPAVSAGEFGVLERGFNEMAANIEGGHRDMKTRIEEATAHLAFQARHDALTGLINRREFEACLEQSISAVQSGAVETTMLFLDLDHFKAVNDTSGHLAGDELLRQLSRLFQGRLRDKDTFARIGGDEFGIVLPDCNQENALRVADDLCAIAGNYRFVWQDQVFSIGVSIGLVKIEPAMRNITDILAAGDAACYLAKDAGRNRVHIHTPIGIIDRLPNGERWRERIERALRERHVRCDVVPIRPLVSGDAFCQMADIGITLEERRGVPITAPVFRDMAERAGLAQAVDERALEIALDTLTQISVRNSQCSPTLLVPLSLSSLKLRGSPEYLTAILERRKYSGKGLCLVLSEEAVIRHIGEAGVLCAALRQYGCKIALTDFGGWLASFNHLDVILPDLIRINRSLTNDLRRHKSAIALVRAIQDISLDRGISTIAESVDDPGALETLRTLGIHYVQGLAVAPAEPLEAWLEGGIMRIS